MSAAGDHTRIAVLDDWQRVARNSADWRPLLLRADVRFFEQPFADEDEAARELLPFEILLVTRERTPLPPSLVARLPNLRMFGLTGHRAGSIDLAGMIARGITVCYTDGSPGASSTAELALALLLSAARHIPAADVAALDVFYREPLPADHPFTCASNVVLTPHLGYSVDEVYREFYAQCIEHALVFLDGKPIRVLKS